MDGNILQSVKGHIELRDISFSYPSRPNLAIFEKFCLSIPAGKTVAIVGASGSGYSHSSLFLLVEQSFNDMLNLRR